jgi:broad specificity phosphatase PhoE
VNIFLVRHGEASASWSDSPDPGLSALGRQQACEAAAQLRPHISGDIIILSSPLQRARQTAEPLASELGREVQVVEAFREIPSPVPLAQRQLWLRNFMQQEWREQTKELIAWRNTAIEHLLILDRSSVVFTHFLVINAVMGHVLKHAATLNFWPANGSVTQLRHTGRQLELVALGQQMESAVN